jgi:phosphohistidine phosphatase
MKLFFLRHGVAADRELWNGEDSERPLTDDGKKRMAREAKALADLDIEPDVIRTSPLLRAKQTASIVAERLGAADRLVEDPRLGPDFDVSRLREILQEHAGASCVMLVGHEPNMSETLAQVIGGARLDLKKGGLAYVDLPDASAMSGELVWLLPPKVLFARD